MLTAIEEIKYFLWTAYGDSKNFSGSTIELKFQGLFQGSDVATVGWAVISITILCANKRKVHGGHFVCLIFNLTRNLAALLFVDDTDMIYINLKAEETVTVTHKDTQDSISNWGQLIIA